MAAGAGGRRRERMAYRIACLCDAAADGKCASQRSGYNNAVRFRDKEEGVCAIRIILKKTGKTTRLAVW
jgi:hypothetical protein